MTDLAALDALIEAVTAGEKVTIPSPYPEKLKAFPDRTARIMAYSEGYVIMRHKGAMPFIMHKSDLLAILKAYRAGL